MKKQYNSPATKTKKMETLSAFAVSMEVLREPTGQPLTTETEGFSGLAKGQMNDIFSD